MYGETLTQRQAKMNGVQPQTLNSSRASTGGVDMQSSVRALFTLYVGAVTAGSISAWLQESSDNFNSDVPSNDAASAFSNSGGTSLSKTGITTSNGIHTFEVRQDQLTAGKRYARLQVKEVNGSNTVVAVTAIGDEASHKPNNALNGTHCATNGSENVVA